MSLTQQTDLTDLILQPTPGRACTDIGCALCCKLPYIEFADEPEKPAGTWCAHCKHPPTCDIYESRPAVCRNFYCVWLGDENWPKHLDPISTGCMVVTEYITGTSRVNGETREIALIRVHESRPGAVAKIDAALRILWNIGVVTIGVFTPNGKLRLIGYDINGARVTFMELDANLYGNNPDLPIITMDDLRKFGWNWRNLRARCEIEHERLRTGHPD